MPIDPALREHRHPRPRGLVLESTRYDCSIRGLLVEVVVTQSYRNPTRKPIEAVFNLAAPTDATFLGLRVRLDGQEHIGVVQPKADASARYEQAIGDGDGAVLLENPEPGQYVVNVGNLKPGTDARVVLRYALWLSPTGDEVRLRLPTVLAPRYGTPLVAPHQQHATDLAARHAFDFHAIVEGPLAQASIACPSHRMHIRQGHGGIGIDCTGAEMDRDVVLVFEGTEIGSAAHVAADGEQTVVVASVRLPPSARPPRPADILFLIDASGSMAGDSINQAAAALAEIAGVMPHHDRFQVLLFGSSLLPLHHAWCGAHEEGRQQLRKIANRLHANLGGTELVPALEECLRRFEPPCDRREAEAESAREKVLFIVSDGQVNDVRLEDVACRMRAAGVRVFAVAVGAAPVRHTFEPLCDTTGGAIEEAFPGEGMAAKVVRHFRRLGSPRWSVAGIDWAAPTDWQVLPDGGHAGDTLRISAGMSLRQAIPPRVRLRDAEGHEATLLPALTDIPGDVLPRMAGRERWSVESSATGRLALAMRHGLLTPETACIVVSERDASARTDGEPQLVAVPQALPAGWGGMGGAGQVFARAALAMDSIVASFNCSDAQGLVEYSDAASSPPDGAHAPDGDWDPLLEGPDSIWFGLALAHLEIDPALRAQLRTGLATVDDLLELLPTDWHAAIHEVARERGVGPQGLVVALIRELLRQDLANGKRTATDADTQATLDAAAACWPVPGAILDELMARLGLAATAA
jgi:Ca-activated chloride channel family protein